MDHLPAGKPILAEQDAHTVPGDEECVGGETLGPSGRVGGRQEKALEVVS